MPYAPRPSSLSEAIPAERPIPGSPFDRDMSAETTLVGFISTRECCFRSQRIFLGLRRNLI